MSFCRLMFGFQGRATRAQFWLAALIWVVAIPGSFLFAGGLIEAMKLRPSYGLFAAFLAMVLVPTLVSIAAVGSKRLHDRGKSGLWMLVFFLVPYFGAPFLVGILPVSENPSDTELMVWASATVLPFLIWGLIELGILPGTPGPNRFGEAPSSAQALQPA